ncbi:transcription elongation factor GreA [Fructilactobacillus fructivorans]|nr:transcription elongation factor GreA [Fructilactobacillus fructivorans]
MIKLATYFNKMTKHGYQQIQDEIKTLEKNRPGKIQALHDAAALGDRSENAEYSTSKRELHQLENRLRYFRKQEQYAEVVSNPKSDQVGIGSKVKVKFLEDGDSDSFIIVGKQEAEFSKLEENKIFYDSPLGKSLLHHQVGETISVKAPEVNYKLKILEISTGHGK